MITFDFWGTHQAFLIILEQVVDLTLPFYASKNSSRLYGGYHLGNILWSDAAIFLIWVTVKPDRRSETYG